MKRKTIRFRPASPDEAALLAKMTMQGLYHWGYKEAFPELMEEFRQNNVPTADYISRSPVTIMTENNRPIGYYGLRLRNREEFVDLRYFFLETAFIGRGYGRKLWQRLVVEARETGYKKLRILSDPAAVGFYQAMGATLGGQYAVQPGFALGIMWYELDNRPE